MLLRRCARLLVLYLTKALAQGRQVQAFAIYGAYTALVYAAPVLGGQARRRAARLPPRRHPRRRDDGHGRVHDLRRGLRGQRACTWAWASDHRRQRLLQGQHLHRSSASSTKDGDPRRDSGFTIFYMGINVGAVGGLAHRRPRRRGPRRKRPASAKRGLPHRLWPRGHRDALRPRRVPRSGARSCEGVGEPPDLRPSSPRRWFLAGMSSRQNWSRSSASFAAVPLLYFLLKRQEHRRRPASSWPHWRCVLYQLLRVGFRRRQGREQRDRIIVLHRADGVQRRVLGVLRAGRFLPSASSPTATSTE